MRTLAIILACAATCLVSGEQSATLRSTAVDAVEYEYGVDVAGSISKETFECLKKDGNEYVTCICMDSFILTAYQSFKCGVPRITTISTTELYWSL